MFPRKWPKSMWNKLPEVVIMMLSLCLSPIPCVQSIMVCSCRCLYLSGIHAMNLVSPECRWPLSNQHRSVQMCQWLPLTFQGQPLQTRWKKKNISSDIFIYCLRAFIIATPTHSLFLVLLDPLIEFLSFPHPRYLYACIFTINAIQ